MAPLTDTQLDQLLDGVAVAGSPLVEFVEGLRADAAAPAPPPTAALAEVLSAGVVGADVPGASFAAATPPAGILTFRGQARNVTRVLVTKFAALGLLAKAATAGAAVTVAASGVGAAGGLPPSAQMAFDDLVGREVAQVRDDADDVADEDGADGEDITPPGAGGVEDDAATTEDLPIIPVVPLDGDADEDSDDDGDDLDDDSDEDDRDDDSEDDSDDEDDDEDEDEDDSDDDADDDDVDEDDSDDDADADDDDVEDDSEDDSDDEDEDDEDERDDVDSDDDDDEDDD